MLACGVDRMMRASRLSPFAAVVALFCFALGASPAPDAAPEADAIFARVRAAWGAGAYPRYASYATIVEFHKDARHIKRTWDTVEDFRHATVFSRKFSREELASPPDAPRGINIAIPFLGTLNKVQPLDPVGHVAFAVDQDYGISPADRRFTAATSVWALDAASKTLSVIGHTGVTARTYDVRLIETLKDDRGVEYHLGLTPLRDPQKNRLRELWVDATTWLPEEAVVAGIGNRAPFDAVPWRIEFRQAHGATYVARETALADVDFGKAGLLRWLTVSFDEFAASAKPEGWKFMLGQSDDRPLSDP